MAELSLIDAYGGELKDLLIAEGETPAAKEGVMNAPVWCLSEEQLCDTELLLNGAFSPLEGFMNRGDYDSVCENMRLTDGTLWPIPICLDVSEEFANGLKTGGWIVLTNAEGVRIARLRISELWRPDKLEEARRVYGTEDETHPGVFKLLRGNPVYVSGKLEGFELPPRYSFGELRQTPAELREAFAKAGTSKVVGFQTRNPMHRAHVELTKRGAEQVGGSVLIHPVVGTTKAGDVDYFLRVKCYQAILGHYGKGAFLSLLPLAMRMAGPREALWHAIIRRNYGCSHFIVGRDHAGPGNDKNGKPFYGPYDAQELMVKYEEELGIKMVPFEEMVYVKEQDAYMPRSESSGQGTVLSLSGTEVRDRLNSGAEIPGWFSYPEVVKELRKVYRPRARQGITVFLTGLPSAGKSTIANILQAKLMETDSRSVTILDGDLVRRMLSSELTFSKEHRDLNIRRIGYVANEITKNGGVAICAPIAPYAQLRSDIRRDISSNGLFVEVHVNTPVALCEERDRKGLYAKARQGLIKGLTGVDDPYEVPENPELRIDTADVSAIEGADMILGFLREQGYIA